MHITIQSLYLNKVKCFHVHSAHTVIFNFRLPEEYYMDIIRPSYTRQVFAKYKSEYEDSFDCFTEYFAVLPSIGIFKRSGLKIKNFNEQENSNKLWNNKMGSNDKLVSWIALRSSGDIGLGFTEPNYRGLGFASATHAYLANFLRQSNHVAYGVIEHSNAIMKKVCYQMGHYKCTTAKVILYSRVHL